MDITLDHRGLDGALGPFAEGVPRDRLKESSEDPESFVRDHAHGVVAPHFQRMFADVVKHKTVFCNASYANRDACLTGQPRLIPEDPALTALRADFQRMIGAGMFIGEPPAFDAVVDRLRASETAINGCSDG